MTDRDLIRKPQRPPLVIVTAVLQLVFGVLSICGPLLYIAGVMELFEKWQENMQASIPKPPPGQPAPPDFSQKRINEMIQARLPWFKSFERFGNYGGLLLSLMMIAGGVGLLKMKSWGRSTTIAWGFLSILNTLVTVLLTFLFVSPVIADVIEQILREMPPPGPGAPNMGETVAGIVKFSIMAGTVFSLTSTIYPIVILCFMFAASVRKAFQPTRFAFEGADDGEEPTTLEPAPEDDDPPDDRIQPAR